MFVEACDAVIAQPFLPPASLRPNVESPPLQIASSETPVAAAAILQTGLLPDLGINQTGLLPDLGAASGDDESLAGEVDIGR
jgi:hypothetical protein